mmetsp:Transcript_13116/g.31289  ORF Transcript_13116/g.31289 Transcript_13116/m.31289 type:complete len:107 (+) Transcript_13116:1996-2316(+)
MGPFGKLPTALTGNCSLSKTSSTLVILVSQGLVTAFSLEITSDRHPENQKLICVGLCRRSFCGFADYRVCLECAKRIDSADMCRQFLTSVQFAGRAHVYAVIPALI